jgi:archaellum component FlaC
MFKIFKREDKFNARLMDIELKLENHQKQTDELREMLLTLARMIEEVKGEVKNMSNRYGKGL